MKRRSLFLILIILSTSFSAFGTDLTHHDSADLSDAISPDSKLTLINFWATWCVPCVAELEDLLWLEAKFPATDLALLGISLDSALPIELEEASERARRMLREKKVGYANLLYTGSQNELARMWDIDSGIPFSVIVDSRGQVLRTYRGRIDRETVEKEIRQLLSDR